MIAISERSMVSHFEVRSGEIVGIAGVQGNGQTELVESITGMRPSLGGSVKLKGEDITTESVRAIHKRSVAHVPEDRQRSGLVLSFTVTENIVLDSYYEEPISHGLRMDWPAAEKQAERLVEQYDVRTPSIDVAVSTLSGGNQQKVIVAREFDRDVTFVVASQPTRGIDVGSIEYIHSRIVEERDRRCCRTHRVFGTRGDHGPCPIGSSSCSKARSPANSTDRPAEQRSASPCSAVERTRWHRDRVRHKPDNRR